ncbi:MAG: hypothetical protein EOM12_14970, partial [Verrucomicrobiae bacterium]|nr:hypothetical protein [Verrucomicrobiae bacterium]
MAFELLSHHEVMYETETRIPIVDVANSLIAFEKSVNLAQPVFFELFREAEIERIQVYVNALYAGSLKDDFLFKFVFKSKEDADIFIKKLRQYTGIEYMQEKHPFIGQILTLALAYGAFVAVNKWAAPNEPSIHIEHVYNSALHVGDGDFTITPDQL